MGYWGTAIKDNDAFADIYGEFFDLYNKGESPENVSQNLKSKYTELLELEEEANNYWFAFALAQWETKTLEEEILSRVNEIISSGADLKLWQKLGADDKDISKRKIALEKFQEKINSERPKPKSRRRLKFKTPIFETGDCFTFQMKNGNYGGAVVLAVGSNPETAYNLVATTRINQPTKPSLNDFENAEVLHNNFAQWKGQADVRWCLPDFYQKDYSNLYELVGRITVDKEYDVSDSTGEGYLFQPSYTAAWGMNYAAESQFESEKTKPRPEKSITIKQLALKDHGSLNYLGSKPKWTIMGFIRGLWSSIRLMLPVLRN